MTDQTSVVPFQAIPAVEEMSLAEYEQWLKEEQVEVTPFEGTSQWELFDKDDKRKLVGVPFVIARLRFTDNESGKFVSVCIFTREGSGLPPKIVFNDGSTGVYRQLESEVTKNGKMTAIMCPKGLRASDYKYTDEEGKQKDATTYYIA